MRDCLWLLHIVRFLTALHMQHKWLRRRRERRQRMDSVRTCITATNMCALREQHWGNISRWTWPKFGGTSDGFGMASTTENLFTMTNRLYFGLLCQSEVTHPSTTSAVLTGARMFPLCKRGLGLVVHDSSRQHWTVCRIVRRHTVADSCICLHMDYHRFLNMYVLKRLCICRRPFNLRVSICSTPTSAQLL